MQSQPKVNEQHMQLIKFKTQDKALQKLRWDNDSSIHVYSTTTLGPHGAIKPLKHPHPIPTHSTPPMYDIPLCMCYEEEKKKKTLNLLPLKEWSQWKWIKQQRRHLHSRASHGPPTEKKGSVQWFQSGKTIVSNLEEREREVEKVGGKEREWVREMEMKGERERENADSCIHTPGAHANQNT